ncbi:putative polyketide hydroxylase [Oryx dammah]|uniref:putative polyketide hydroxylase n=1 Tax=Oryx dammah TaxID=59534 RepID=UPI001A9BE91D|nr:putative polyketide hydroxylase [Oryx dammah]
MPSGEVGGKSGPRTQRPNFGKEIWREAGSNWKDRVLGAGGLRDLSPSGPEGCEVPHGAFRGAGSPEEAACAPQGRRLRRRAPELRGGAGGSRAASRRGGGTGPGRPSSRDRTGSGQSQGEALRHGGAPGGEGPPRRGSVWTAVLDFRHVGTWPAVLPRGHTSS